MASRIPPGASRGRPAVQCGSDRPGSGGAHGLSRAGRASRAAFSLDVSAGGGLCRSARAAPLSRRGEARAAATARAAGTPAGRHRGGPGTGARCRAAHLHGQRGRSPFAGPRLRALPAPGGSAQTTSATSGWLSGRSRSRRLDTNRRLRAVIPRLGLLPSSAWFAYPAVLAVQARGLWGVWDSELVGDTGFSWRPPSSGGRSKTNWPVALTALRDVLRPGGDAYAAHQRLLIAVRRRCWFGGAAALLPAPVARLMRAGGPRADRARHARRSPHAALLAGTRSAHLDRAVATRMGAGASQRRVGTERGAHGGWCPCVAMAERVAGRRAARDAGLRLAQRGCALLVAALRGRGYSRSINRVTSCARRCTTRRPW